MNRLNPNKLHVRYLPGVETSGPLTPRRYTLTHSDATGDLFLSIGPDYDREAISGWYTRLMRDEVLAEWQKTGLDHSLHLYCHVSGGIAFGPAGWRYRIFQRELPLVLEALRYGDDALYAAFPNLDRAPIWVHFRSIRRLYRRNERWGAPGEYRVGIF
ncbi:MAG: staygreen family protein [Anaerolineales bacterium]|nr:staygreen family protein [Anaerolineales bacterium]